MVGERRNGNLLVQLGPKLQAYPEELIRQRRTHDGQTEYLIRWCLVTIDDGSNSGGGAGETGGAGSGSSGVGGSGSSTSGESKPENILMWMSTEDVYANCPTLLGKRKTDTQEKKQGGVAADGGQRSGGDEFQSDATFDEVELSDMKEDVKNLVRRARKQMAKKSDFSISITHTIHVLSAYASIGSLVGVFKETGALNLLMELLCNKETQTRRSAGKMLRALASHDAGSRAYVLLSLSQQDGIEQHMDFDNRYTLLELFAETTSSEEHGISFEGIHLPQIPGKLLFSLVKRYLCVTSLMDKLNTAGAESSSDRLDASPSPASTSAAHQSEHLRVQREFDFTMAMANLISELVRVMGWDRNRQPPDVSAHGPGGAGACGEEQVEGASRPILRSIFQPRFCASPVVLPVVSAIAAPAPAPPKKKTSGNGFKTRSDFASRSAYAEYVQDNLKSGMMVRMLEDYEEVSNGDEGEFRYSNDGSPPVQVYWNSLSRTYWVHWHMVEILGSGSSSQAEKETQEKVSSLTETIKLTTVSQTFFSKPPGGLYSLPYLSERQQTEAAALSRAEWWEILFFIKKLEPQQQQEVNVILLQSLDEQDGELDDSSLIGLTVHGDVAKKLLHYLRLKLPPSCLSDLLCSHVFSKHYVRRGGGQLEDEELLAEGSLGYSSLGGGGGAEGSSSSSAGSSSSSFMGSVSKKLKKEAAADSETENELPEDDSKYPDDLEDKMKLFNSPRVQGKKTALEKMGEVVDILKKGGSISDPVQQLAAVLFITRLLEENGPQEKNYMRTDSAQTTRDKVLKLLVELLGSSSRDVAVGALRLTHLLMTKYEWRVSFATEGGVKAVLSCMQEFSSVAHVQQLALATLKVITGASKHDFRGVGSGLPLSESGTQMMLEIFASIGSATPEGSRGLLGAVPNAIDLMLKTKGCMPSVRNGLLVIIMLISNHKSLAEQLVACDVTGVLKKCLGLSGAETMLAIIALNHISIVHKLESKDTELQMLIVSLKEATKEVIQTLEQLLCADNTPLDDERCQVTHNRGTYQDLVRQMEQHRADRAVQLSILRILNKFLDHYEEDVLPWHESIEPCLSSMTAFVSDREVVQPFIHFLYRLASLNKDYAVVMCRLGTKEVLVKALDKHGTNLLLVTELRDVVSDCDKYASLYKKMTTSVLAGCIQMVLGHIEEHRRSHQPINIPFFNVFLRNLCQGSSVELKEDKCWEKVEVSSNHHRANKLSDKNPKTYWESNGCTGSHFINVYMHKGVVIRQLAILVASEDSSYMPARVLVLGGDDPTNINTELNTGGIDTRVHGFEVLGPKPTFWPVFKEQLCCRTFLFYSTKAHSWCQEVTEDKTQLLQLFNNEYLENAESARRCKGRAAIFNSRVRRLTHLLVHVDTSRPDGEELKPPVKSNGKESKNKDANAASSSSTSSSVKPKVKSSSSIAGIALCWQGVVKRQVKKFLESSCSLPDFVERYRTLYLRLKNAMEELFGQQTAFVLALRHGFSAALLQLSILRAMHVSERFAQYLDQMIQVGGAGSGSVETLERLQQFLEPMLFLSGLELANTFEHFYRYYLGDRLLAQGNVWLEGAVVDHIGSCFPSRFPQQMLKNLSESSELQQEFHLYRLQQLDRRLQEHDQEVQVEALLQTTRLSAAVLLHALTPLISDGGPLTCSPPKDPIQGVLMLNQQVASRSSDSVPTTVRLLPRQMYLNVDEDAAGTLERKRNYIYCLIVHIMKQEKEMHIDNLVFKVLDSCQKREASGSAAAGRFGCSTSDVLSCIMHVISKGCVRRNEENPHIVEFLPEDPSTPQKGQAQFSFSRTETGTDAISLVVAPRLLEDGVLDAVLFSMGRTMTQEEVRQLMQKTVQQVSGTLSLDLDRAEHLLLHCKWNVDLLVQRYTDDPDALIMAAGIKCRNPQPPPSPASTCPVCLGPRNPEPVPSLSCMHYCCRDFAINLENKVSSINEALQMKSLTFVIDACKVLAQGRKVSAYSCVYSYYNQETEKMDVMEQQTEALDLHTNALQILLEETLLQCTDLASCVRLLKPEHLNTGLELIRRIQERLLAILQHSTQDFRVGYQSKSSQEPESTQTSNLSNNSDANKVSESGDSDNNNRGEEAEDDEYDEEYVPEWHEDYDEDDIDEDDFFSDDDESENLERDFSPFD
ncbi:hypothetical protein F2P81_020666 [Scophthalmus maximus]|uniref:Cullin-9 n=1 Tax=Scophthalmus maximus TaxID=52904 RepID=A0A6A4S6P8_SCOMX|nr:hypothetical protein F2P81_020666 [Scophthalmus maximus]